MGTTTATTDSTVRAARRAIREAGGLLTPLDISREWGVSQPAIVDRIRRGNFPEPVKIAGRVRLYLRAEVEPYRYGTRSKREEDR